ncbi:caspase family protein [bacterium]|nr:caspase family protein [candidate division CSSED10-310 bacterium]
MSGKRMYIVFIACYLVLQASSLCYGSKRALVIGNGEYAGVPLRNPLNDANDITSTLEKLGFAVTKKTNATQQEMEEAIRAFGNQLQASDTALFYFSGHGSQVDGINYLLPIGADIRSENEVKYKAVDAGMVLDKIEQSGSHLNIIILDACRNNPYRGVRSASRGLAVMSASSGTLIAYATAPGTVAFDGEGKNSPYTKNLLNAMQMPGLKIEDVFKTVRRAVMAETQNKQVPWEASSLIGDFYFVSEQPPQQEQPQTMLPVRREFISEVTASSTLKPQRDSKGTSYRYDPQNAVDGDLNTAWVEGVSEHGIHEWLKVTFTRAVLIKTITLIGGYKSQNNDRIKILTLSFSDGSSQTVSLADTLDPQTFQLTSPRVTNWIQFIIGDVYPGTRFKDTPISEITFE